MRYRVFHLLPTPKSAPMQGWVSDKTRAVLDFATADEAKADCLTHTEASRYQGQCRIVDLEQNYKEVCSAHWSRRTGVVWSSRCKI